jgi:hypothetical protein
MTCTWLSAGTCTWLRNNCELEGVVDGPDRQHSDSGLVVKPDAAICSGCSNFRSHLISVGCDDFAMAIKYYACATGQLVFFGKPLAST